MHRIWFISNVSVNPNPKFSKIAYKIDAIENVTVQIPLESIFLQAAVYKTNNILTVMFDLILRVTM